MELETKAVEHGQNYEVKQAFEDFMAGFAAFRQANDERLAGLERRSGDVLSEEKVARIDTALTETRQKIDQLMLASARPVLGGERKACDPALSERKARFDRYVRKGDGLDIEVKAMSEGSNADGGYTVPLEIERTIDRVLSQASPIRAIACVRQIGGGTYRKPITTAGAASGWVGETGSISQTGTPTLAALDFPAMELYAMPAATQTLLDDSQVDIEQWLATAATSPRAFCITPMSPMPAGRGAISAMSPRAPMAHLPPAIRPTPCWTWPMRPSRVIAPMAAG
jgi:HK97 family phage major capsid protein